MDSLFLILYWFVIYVFQIHSTLFPVDFLGGLAFAGFAVLYILIEKFKWWNGTPLQYLGTNSILIYIGHLVFASYFPIQWIVAYTHAAHLAMALWGCIFWMIIAYIFFKKRTFLVL